ncbi:ABC transporter substrate-binding protein [Nonomuraea glycinis]|nr:ABC transporter substrate-binding protein [Nonomuraea glycinis]MCA2181243.1 ABC transporter substrate-binding protein [Nonomuraea glycinis]
MTATNVVRKLLGMAAVFTLVGSLAACGGDDSASTAATGGPIKITISTVAADSGAQGFLAKEKGFFTAQGLDVDVKIVAGVPELAAAVQSGGSQFALTSPASIASASASGIPFRIVAGGLLYTKEKPGVWLMIGDKATDVKELKDLGGKSIATNALNTLPHLSTLAALDDAGVDVKTVNFVTLNFPAIGQALESGQVPAGAVVSPFYDQQEAAKIAHRLVSPYDSVNNGKDFLNTTWFAKEDYIADNAAVVEKFRAAMKATNAWANDPANEAERKSILQKYTELPDDAINALELALYGDETTPDLVQPLLDVMVRFGALKEPIKAETIIAADGK